MIGRQVSIRLQPAAERKLLEYLPHQQHPHLLRSLLTLTLEGLKRDPFLLSEILIGGVRPDEYELRVYRKELE
jgi:hypothetical protein